MVILRVDSRLMTAHLLKHFFISRELTQIASDAFSWLPGSGARFWRPPEFPFLEHWRYHCRQTAHLYLRDPSDDRRYQPSPNMLQEVHPIQAALPPFSPVLHTRTVKYCGLKTWAIGIGLCPCGLALAACPLDERTERVGGGMPKEYVDAKFKLQALGLEPAVIFPGGAIAPTGLKMQKEDPSVPSDPAFSELFHHPIFDEPPREFKPDCADKISHYYNGFWQTIVKYTICLPLTIAEKTNSCGCSEKLSDEALEIFITGMIQGIVDLNTEKPHSPARQLAVNMFAEGCWDGPTLVGVLAPVINEAVNDNWYNIRTNTYSKQTGTAVLELIFEAPGYTPEVERATILKMKQLILQKCVLCCNGPVTAWNNEEAKEGAKQIGKWIMGKIGGIGGAVELASSMV